MKPIADVVIQDKQAEATLRKLFEDLYNRVLPSDVLNKALRTGKLDRPHIDYTQTGTEISYAWIYAHSFPVANAVLYIWAIRRYGTSRWTEYFSSENETKIVFLPCNTQYEVKVRAVGALLLISNWSATTLVLTPTAPQPSVVSGITVVNAGVYKDPTTGVTLASVRIRWDNNAVDELVDEYDVIWD